MSEPNPDLAERRTAARAPLQERVARAIVDAAAREFFRAGEQASMSDVAVAAGVARATVYRYFPSRLALFESLVEITVGETAERLRAARIGELAVDEALERAVRALLEGGEALVVAARGHTHTAGGLFESGIASPLRRLVERGQESGILRSDISSSLLTDSLLAQVVAFAPVQRELGREDAVVAVTGLFLHGAQARPRVV